PLLTSSCVCHLFTYVFVTFFCLIIRLPPTPTLFPYTTLFRSRGHGALRQRVLDLPHRTHRKDLHLHLRHRGFLQRATQRARELRSEEHTSELQSRENLVCRLLLEKKKKKLVNYKVSGKTKEKK